MSDSTTSASSSISIPSPPPPPLPPRGYQDPLETWSAKFSRKFNENPWVPIGCFLTCGALVMSAAKLKQGKSRDMNHWLRARVAFQGITIVALLVGSMQLQKTRKLEEEKVNAYYASLEEQVRTNVDRDKDEFEKRLKEAERVTAEEEELVRQATKRLNLEGGKEGKKASTASWWPWSR